MSQSTAEDKTAPTPVMQAISFFAHTVLAVATWIALMLVGYQLNPIGISQAAILAFSTFVPLVMGSLINRFRQDEMAIHVWLIGLIWILIVSLWILDLPTGPNQCMGCNATEKMTRTLFSYPKPSGLIDNDGPFIGTWPSFALLGYAIGARLSLRKRPRSNDY
jgi:hypothetical protein